MCFIFFIFISRRLYNFGICSVSFLRGVLLLLYLSCYIRLFYVCWSYQRRKSTWHFVPPPPFFLYLHKKNGFRLYCSPKQKNSLWWPQVGFFLIVAYFEKVKIIYVKIFFYIFIWQERNHLWFFLIVLNFKIRYFSSKQTVSRCRLRKHAILGKWISQYLFSSPTHKKVILPSFWQTQTYPASKCLLLKKIP